MAGEKKPDEDAIGFLQGILGKDYGNTGALGNLPPYRETGVTEDTIARGIAKAISNSISTVESERDVWIRLFSGPAPLISRLAVVPYQGHVRVAFGEQYDAAAPTQFRAAVTMSDYNAWELWKILGQQQGVQYWEDRFQEQQAEAKKEAEGDVPKG